MKQLLPALLLCISLSAAAQNNTQGTKRILILLDGSGSMLDEWKGTTKWSVAKNLVSQTIDSIQKNDPQVEIGLRVFGHQSPRAMKDCEDSKLEVPIGKNTAKTIQTKLTQIVPKGNTPIAYSLFLAAGDFPDREGVNSIILITDGIENCEGDPCASSDALRNKRISLRPFIIGVGLNENEKTKFDCVGSYYDASDAVTFKNAMNIVISQALNNTTTQINLINAFGDPLETNIEMTLYDAFSGEVRYDLVHSLNTKNQPDTLFLDPVGKYSLVVHTVPVVVKNNIELVPGKHNIIGIDVPQGALQLTETGSNAITERQCIIRDPATNDIIAVQNFNTQQKYLAGTYNLEILTTPRMYYTNYILKGGVNNQITIDQPGTLSVSAAENSAYAVFAVKDDIYEKEYESTTQGGTDLIQLQPGEYHVVYRSNVKKSAENTKSVTVVIKSGKTYTLKL